MRLSDARIEAVIAVGDLAAAARFYEEQLQLEPVERDDQSVRYACAGDTRLFIYLSPDNAGKSPATAAGWFVDDLEATMADLRTRGVVFEQLVGADVATDARDIFEGPGLRAAWVKDPAGNVLAITERA